MPPALQGRRVVVTRAREQAGELMARLQALGADAIHLPTIAIAPPLDSGPLDRALAGLTQFDGFVFTSVNGVRGFLNGVRGGAPARPAQAWVCAIGEATAVALQAAGWRADTVPAQAVGEALLAALGSRSLRGQRILVLRAEAGRELIPGELTRRGASVTLAATHRTTIAEGSRAPARALFPGADAAVFSSPSTARNLAALLGEDYGGRLRHTALVAIGPVTRQAIEALGLRVAAEAREASTAGMVAAILESLQETLGA